MSALKKALTVCLITVMVLFSNVYAYTLEKSNERVENYNYTGTAVPVYNSSSNSFMVGITDIKNPSITGQSSAYYRANFIIRPDNILDTTEKSVTFGMLYITKTNDREWNPISISIVDTTTGQLHAQIQWTTSKMGTLSSPTLKTNRLYKIEMQATVYPPIGGATSAAVQFLLPVETQVVIPTNTTIDVHQDNRCTAHAGDTP
jgi:hypothetical protein